MHPNRQIIFKIHKLVFLIDKISDKLLQQQAGSTHSQFLMLMAIKRNPEVSQRSIAEFLEITQAAVSRQIEHLLTKKTGRQETSRQPPRASSGANPNRP